MKDKGIVFSYEPKKGVGRVRSHTTNRDYTFNKRAIISENKDITIGDIVEFTENATYTIPIAENITIIQDSRFKDNPTDVEIPEVEPYTRVFGIGGQKTGTSTLGMCLKDLGFNLFEQDNDLICFIHRGDWDKTFEIADKYTAFEDHPWVFIYKELDKKYPDSKFILTIRDYESQAKSTIYQSIRAVKPERRFRVNAAMYNHYCYKYVTDHEQDLIKLYKEHDRKVIEYFKDKPGKLLVIDWWKGEGWYKLCKFLGKPIPDKPFPHAKSAYPWPYYDELFDKAKANPREFYGEKLYGMKRYWPSAHIRDDDEALKPYDEEELKRILGKHYNKEFEPAFEYFQMEDSNDRI